MRTTYHLTLSDGSACDVKGDSASEAIAKALNRYRGRTVQRCFAGNFLMQDREAGRTDYEVPPHKAMPPRPPKNSEIEE